ncbi:MAG TPA: VIT1/CCC1 transporter family protein [archaeon]|nr:VIT1/CCC1 transporter family protein [archaeon]
MRPSFKAGFSFGLASGIITTLGLIVGLDAGTQSQLAVIGGILTIAVADAFSDSLGVHVSQESENHHSTKEIWESTIATFFAKLVFALSFLVPVLLLPLSTAIIASVFYGLILLAVLSFFIARQGKTPVWKAITEHLAIAIVVIIAAQFLGTFISTIFV